MGIMILVWILIWVCKFFLGSMWMLDYSLLYVLVLIIDKLNGLYFLLIVLNLLK